MAHIDIYRQRVFLESKRVADRKVREFLRVCKQEAKIGALQGKYVTGRTARSIRTRGPVTTGRQTSGRVEATTAYSHIFEKGAKPHIIRPRGPWLLRFYWRRVGRHVALRRVRHPGYKGRRFMTDALVRAALITGFKVKYTPYS